MTLVNFGLLLIVMHGYTGFFKQLSKAVQSSRLLFLKKKMELLGVVIVRPTAKVIPRLRIRSYAWQDGESNLGPPGCRSRALPPSSIPGLILGDIVKGLCKENLNLRYIFVSSYLRKKYRNKLV